MARVVDVVIAIIVAVAFVVIVVAVLVGRARQRARAAGIDGFRRHIDALSPESRREVKDRVLNQKEHDEGPQNGTGPGPNDPGLG